MTAKERTRLEDAFGAWELKTDPDSEEHGFVEHQDIPQLIRALGYPLSNEVRATTQCPLRVYLRLISSLRLCLHQDLGIKLADANIGETMEYDEYLLLIKQLGKRPDKSAEVRELKGAIAMVTKDKEYISTPAQMCRRSATGRESSLWSPAAMESMCRITTVCLSQTSTI